MLIPPIICTEEEYLENVLAFASRSLQFPVDFVRFELRLASLGIETHTGTHSDFDDDSVAFGAAVASRSEDAGEGKTPVEKNIKFNGERHIDIDVDTHKLVKCTPQLLIAFFAKKFY